jgi:hypothetical protein
MPELPVKEVRMPELHLPELKRDDIVRTLSEIRMPDVDVRKVDVTNIDLPRIDLPRFDIGKLVAGALAAMRIARPVARPRLPLALGAIGVVTVVAMVGWALMRSPAVRERADRAARLAKERIDSMRANDELGDVGNAVDDALGSIDAGASIDALADDMNGRTSTFMADAVDTSDDLVDTAEDATETFKQTVSRA